MCRPYVTSPDFRTSFISETNKYTLDSLKTLYFNYINYMLSCFASPELVYLQTNNRKKLTNRKSVFRESYYNRLIHATNRSERNLFFLKKKTF